MKLLFILYFLTLFNSLVLAASDPFRVTANSHHKITLLNSGIASFEERLEMIDSAKDSIDAEYFIYNLDDAGRIFAQALIKKAQEGIKVRMLLDYSMVKSVFTPFLAYEMEKNGVEIKYFNPTSSFNIVSGIYRNHRKSLIIDGNTVITGGRNIGNEYFDLSEEYNFLDRELKISGEIVNSIQESFNEIWENSLSIKIERKKVDTPEFNSKVAEAKHFLSFEDPDWLNEIRSIGKAELSKEYQGSCESVTFNSEYPIVDRSNRSRRIIKYSLAERINNSEKSILFDTAYFITNKETKLALENALAKNIDVTLLTNSLESTDTIYVADVFDFKINNWISKGLKSYVFSGTVPKVYVTIDENVRAARFGIHAKTFVFDQKDVVIGTYNFDPRSANLNIEMTITCENNPELAQHVSDDIKSRIVESDLLDSKDAVKNTKFLNVSNKLKFEYFLFKIPSLILQFLL